MNLEYETDRLLLKILKADDADDVLKFLLNNKAFFEQYEPLHEPHYYTVEHQRAILICEYNLTVKLSAVRFYVFKKEQPNQIIGTICFRNITRSFYQRCEVGYKFDQDFQHHGYAYEALCMGFGIMFEDQKLHRIEADVMPSNLLSIRLLKSLGFEEEGLVRKNILIQNVWEDHLRYSLIRP